MSFHLTVASPDGKLFDGEAEMLTLRAAEGDMAVMAEHVSYITTVKACTAVIHLPSEEEKRFSTSGGLLSVNHNHASVLCGSVKWEESTN